MSGLSTNGTESGYWPTPKANESTTTSFGKPTLSGMVRHNLWPTPTKRDWKGTNGENGLTRKDGKSRMDQLPNAVAYDRTWPTPSTTGMCGGSGGWELLNRNTTVEEARRMGAGNGGHLNPDWVELLMGWPKGWTDLDAFPGSIPVSWNEDWEEGVPRVVKDVKNRRNRLMAIGNGQVPACAVLAWLVLTEEKEKE